MVLVADVRGHRGQQLTEHVYATVRRLPKNNPHKRRNDVYSYHIGSK
jgi:hypothetical protein